MRASEFLTEGRNYPVIVVDVQPEYSGINDGDENYVFPEIMQFVQNQTGPVLMFVNAEDQGLSGDTVQDIVQYWNNTLGTPDEESWDDEGEYTYTEGTSPIDWNRFTIVDKGYGYLRSWMDQGVAEAAIIKTIREMYRQKVNDSRELFDMHEYNEDYNVSMQNFLGNEYQAWMAEDGIYVGWTSIAQLKQFNGAYVVGGGRTECLREVELLMNAFNIKYKRIDHLVYD